MRCGVGHRRGSDLALLWLCCRPAATALIRRLAWEPPYAMGVALKGQKRKKKKEFIDTEINLVVSRDGCLVLGEMGKGAQRHRLPLIK